jgi:hypothetical protein
MAQDLEAVRAKLDMTLPSPKSIDAPAEPFSAADPFAQTVRLDAPEAVQNPPAPQPNPKP